MKKVFRLGLIVTFSIILFSCTKDGDQGPAGPAGADGADGNASVKTETITVYSSEWVYGDLIYWVDKNSEILTQEIVENGSVHLYLNAGEDIWLALPYLEMGYGYSPNMISILTGGNPSTSTIIFKLVAIEGNMVSKSSNIDFQNYDKVKQYFNLED